MTKRIIIALTLSILLWSDLLFAENTPVAFLPERTYNFKSVLEGTEVTHDFILHNKGDAMIDIIKLESG